MELISLKLQNFKRYKNKEFNFKNGFTGIVGKNGSGKSTIFESIRFALFGSTQTKKELLKNSLVYKDTLKVELEFVFDEKNYLIIREYRGSSNKAVANIYENSELKASDVKSVNLFIKELIKMDEKAFLSTVFSSQKELMKLSVMNKEERKSMIRELLGFEKIDKVQKSIKEKSRDLKIEIESFNSILMSKEEENEKLESIKNIQKEIENLKENISKKEKEEEEILSIIELATEDINIMSEKRDKKKDKENQEKLWKNDILNQEKALLEKEKALEKIEEKEKEYEQNSHYQKEYEDIEKEINKLNIIKSQEIHKKRVEEKDKKLEKKYNDLLAKKEKLENQKIDIKEIDYQKLVTTNQINVLENLQKKLNEKERNLNDRIKEKETRSKDLITKLEKIERLGKKAICPTCNRPLEKEYDEVVDSLRQDVLKIKSNELDVLNYTLYQINEKLKKVEESLYLEGKIKEDLQQQESEYKTQITELKSLEKELMSILEDINENKLSLKDISNVEFNEEEYQNKKDLYEDLKQKRDDLIKLKTEISKKANFIDEKEKIQENLEEIKESLEESEKIKIDFEEEDYKNLNKQLAENRDKKEKILKEIYKFNSEKSSKNRDIKNINEKLEENKKQKTKILNLQKDFDDYKKLDVIVKDFKNRLNSKISPMITKKATYLFLKITDGKYSKLEIDDDFDIYIYDNGEKYKIERFSGGEIDLANLVLRIAISQTIMEMNSSTQISFLAFDEIFGSQDEERREMILRAFYEIKEQFREIFVISHEADIKDKFDNLIEL